METKYCNNEKSLRLQELYETSIEKCAREAKQGMWTELIILVIMLPLISFLFNPPMLWLKIAALAIIAVGVSILMRRSMIANRNKSRAANVEELLRVNDLEQKRVKRYYLLFMGMFYVAWVALHYKGQFDGSFITECIVWALLIPVTYWFSDLAQGKDCEEISEIKELVQEN